MYLKEYFTAQSGMGILATANTGGEVDTAIYAKPHVMEDGTIAFIMRDRLTRSNLLVNPRANYMFVEQSKQFKGVRLFIKKIRETDDHELIASLARRRLGAEDNRARGPRYMVSFVVERILPLIGSEPMTVH